MGARESWALTEVEIKKLETELEFKQGQLKYVFNILVYTGIRISDWQFLAKEWNRSKTNWLNVFIPKQSNRKSTDADGNIKVSSKKVQRRILMPKLTLTALRNKEWELQEWSESNIKKLVSKIQDIANAIGISRKISPHDLRATFINMLKHRGYDIFDVKNITQHASLKSLEVYFSRDADVVEQAYKSLAHDPYDSKHPKLLAKEINRLKRENELLRAGMKHKLGNSEERFSLHSEVTRYVSEDYVTYIVCKCNEEIAIMDWESHREEI